MRRILFFLFLLPVMAWAGKETPAKKLVSLLTECREREDLVPDSFFSDVLLLKHEIKEQKDSAAKAVYSATLAHILMQNAYLGQSRKRETESHPDSIAEWGREEYLQHAINLYNYALKDLELLHNAPTTDWLPLVKRGEDEKLYNSSMLAVVFHAMRGDFRYENRNKSYALLPYATLIRFYENHGLREGAFRLCMDSLDGVWKHDVKEKYLLQLKEDYQNQLFCDEVYCKLSDLKAKDEEKRQILEEGLKLYPKSNRIKNEIEELKNPLLICAIPNCMYPGEEIEVEVESGRNMRGVRLITYRLPDDFSEDEDEDWNGVLAHVLRVGKQVKKEIFTFAPHSDFETWKDTLRMQAPSDFGYYGMVIEPINKGRINKDDEEKRKFCRFYVSKLRALRIGLPNKQTQIVVVDGKSGKPEQGVSVKVMLEQNVKTRKSYTEYITDERGKVTFDTPISRDEIRADISKGDDRFSTMALLRRNYFVYDPEENEVEQLRIYTDRSIYRPGQTVYIGGVAFHQKGKETAVIAGEEYKFTFSDRKGNTLAERWIKTDEFGVISDSASLPKDAAPGNYRIRVGSTYSSVRVEEYRRPTFSVEMDPAPAVSFPADSIHLTGKAVTYSGVPVVNARVTGKTSYYAGFWGWRGDAIDYVLKDTLYTDAEGRFKVGLPLNYIQEDIRYGASLTLDVDVLSQQGETEHGNITVRMSSRPYVLNGNVLARQDKDALRTWIFGLYSSTGAKVDGDIVCRILEGKDTEKARLVIPANKPVTPDELKTLPSGVYKVVAEYVNGKDTARYEQKIELFSLADTRVISKDDVFMYTPCDTFAIDRSAKVQIGTPLKDAWMYCTMLHHDKIVLDTLMCLSDTAFVWDIPYKEEYGDGVRLEAYLYNNKAFSGERINLHLGLPKKELTKHWETFRDRLRPGQQEEWRLSLRKPDGKPANANVLLSMYDASLDAILKHKIGFELNYMHRISSLNYLGGWYPYNNYVDFHFKMIGYKAKYSWEFSQFNHDFVLDPSSSKNISLSRSGRFGLNIPTREYAGAAQRFPPLMAKANRSVSADAVLAAAPEVDGLAFESVDQALNGKIAGLDIKDPELAEGEMRGTKRDAFSELAFFCPTLRTDANGEVKISFTLPESLTSWHLTGFAHDKDLFTTQIDETIVAQKELMAELYLPRFLRSGDEATFTASIRNMSERLQQGKANCVIMDAETEKVLARFPVQFRLEASGDTVYTFPVGSVRDNTALLIKWVAEGTDYSDGEQRQLPILSDLEDVTETRAFFVSGKGTSKFNLESLFAHNHPSATNRNMVVEYTARPAWLALKALPSLFTPHCKCVLCTSAAYYATSMAQHILRHVPDADALVDSLHYDGMISLDYRMSLLSSLSALQRADGGFMWFPGMGSNNYLTVEVAYQLARLRHVGVASDAATVVADRMLKRAMDYLAKDVRKQLKDVKNKKDKQITYLGLRYLYIQSLVDNILTDEQRKDQKLLIELLQPAEGREYTIEEAALAAIVLKRNGKDKLAERYLEGLDKKLTHPDGYYISYISGSFTSINRKVQTHVQVMEAFQEVKPQEQQLLNGMTEWLLQQKRTQQWDEPVKTVNAVYALLLDGSQPLEKGNSDVLKLREGQKTHTFVTPHTSVGYLRDSLTVSVPKELRVEKNEKGLSWGAVYATYQMPLDSVRASWQGFHIRRDVSTEQPKVGDRLHVRYTITADRDYEFVQLTSPRSAAAEPDASLSGYRYQNGLGYYRQIRDDRTEYYFDRMPKGTYVIEEDWLISRSGNYQTGSTIIKCLYAPEFSSFTSSDRVKIH